MAVPEAERGTQEPSGDLHWASHTQWSQWGAAAACRPTLWGTPSNCQPLSCPSAPPPLATMCPSSSVCSPLATLCR